MNAITGSPLYMAPEADRSQDEITPLSDIYALGAVGYNLLTGKELFDSRNAIEVIGLQMSQMPVPPSVRIEKRLPEDLEALLLECLAKEPAKRPQGAKALSKRLLACADARAWRADSAAAWWKERGGRISTAKEKPAEQAVDAAAETMVARDMDA